MKVADPLATTTTTKCVVLRPFNGMGTTFLRGEVVDTTGWRTVASLVDRRYLSALPFGAKPVTIDLDGPRTFIDQAHADAAFDEAVKFLSEPSDDTTEKPVLATPERETPKGKR